MTANLKGLTAAEHCEIVLSLPQWVRGAYDADAAMKLLSLLEGNRVMVGPIEVGEVRHATLVKERSDYAAAHPSVMQRAGRWERFCLVADATHVRLKIGPVA